MAYNTLEALVVQSSQWNQIIKKMYFYSGSPDQPITLSPGHSRFRL